MNANVAEILRGAGFAVPEPVTDPTSETAAAIRTHLVALAEAVRRNPALVHALTDSFLLDCGERSDPQLKALLSALQDDADRHAGRAPEGDTAGVACRRCGPVFVHPSIAAVLPVAEGWPTALGCPWCFIRGVAIPRPSRPWRVGDGSELSHLETEGGTRVGR